jgi:HK97 family phage portal protein
MSPIAQHRETIGGAIALDRYGHRVYRNGPVMRGVVTMKGRLSPQARREFHKEWRAMTTRGRQHGVPILDEDAQFNPVSMPLHDMEYVELKRLAVAEIARILLVPASAIGGSGDGSLTYRTVEGDALNFLKYGLQGPSFARIQQALMADRDLFPDPETRYCAFKTSELLRPDTLKRYQAYGIAVKNQWLSVDEVREDDDRDPLPNGQGALPHPAPAPNLAPGDAANAA